MMIGSLYLQVWIPTGYIQQALWEMRGCCSTRIVNWRRGTPDSKDPRRPFRWLSLVVIPKLDQMLL